MLCQTKNANVMKIIDKYRLFEVFTLLFVNIVAYQIDNASIVVATVLDGAFVSHTHLLHCSTRLGIVRVVLGGYPLKADLVKQKLDNLSRCFGHYATPPPSSTKHPTEFRHSCLFIYIDNSNITYKFARVIEYYTPLIIVGGVISVNAHG